MPQIHAPFVAFISLPLKTHTALVASMCQPHAQSHLLPHSAAILVSHVWHCVPRMATVQNGSSHPLFANSLVASLVPFLLQVCHDNLPLSCYLEPLELLLLLEQSPAQNWVICYPQLGNTSHSRYVCNHSTSSSEAVNMANFSL
jgi:hypothetical protein